MKRKHSKIHINYKKFIRSSLILLLLIILIFFGLKKIISSISSNNINSSASTVANVEPTPIPVDKSFNFVAIGDIMCHNTNFKGAYNSTTKTYDFSSVFKNVGKYISKADISFGNLETTFAGESKGYSGYPTFNSPIELGKELKNLGIDVLSTANNHSMDKGASGVVNTLDALDELQISHAGTSRSVEEQNKVLVKEVNGLKIAFIAFTYGTNGIPIPSGKEYLINLIDKDLILKQIELAKEQNVDILCASMHWGIEYAQKQNKEQEDLADFLFQNGVDIIIGNHAHVIEPMEKKTITLSDGTQKEVFVVYALGNFVSGQVKEHTKTSIILDMQITKKGETGKLSINNISYIPLYCHDHGATVQGRYELIDILSSISNYESGNSNITSNLYNTLKKELENTKKVLGEEYLYVSK